MGAGRPLILVGLIDRGVEQPLFVDRDREVAVPHARLRRLPAWSAEQRAVDLAVIGKDGSLDTQRAGIVVELLQDVTQGERRRDTGIAAAVAGERFCVRSSSNSGTMSVTMKPPDCPLVAVIGTRYSYARSRNTPMVARLSQMMSGGSSPSHRSMRTFEMVSTR